MRINFVMVFSPPFHAVCPKFMIKMTTKTTKICNKNFLIVRTKKNHRKIYSYSSLRKTSQKRFYLVHCPNSYYLYNLYLLTDKSKYLTHRHNDQVLIARHKKQRLISNMRRQQIPPPSIRVVR